ncbi:FAD-dependent oxidoreductase [Streptomyces sp. NPDC048481]|uniref:FAD-dependent oxidoreductase n=1 Tax=Streptomyces sp. NPDC048481 TaxID=3365557 RepID=UPI003711B44B
MEDHVTPRRVVIVGGGFAGPFAARALRRSPVAVTLIDRRAHHLFQPLRCQCAAGILSEGQIAQLSRAVLRRNAKVRCLPADADEVVDVKGRVVHAQRPEGGSVVVPYDDLIVAAGTRQSHFGHDEFAAHAPGDPGGQLHPGTRVVDLDEHGLTVQDRDGADRAASGAHRAVDGRGRGAAHRRGPGAGHRCAAGPRRPYRRRTRSDPSRPPGDPGGRRHDGLALDHLPGLAEIALQSGAYAGRSVRRAVEGRAKQPKPFRYVEPGSAACIARGRAVVEAGPVHLSGVAGRLTWLFTHIAFLTEFRSRLGALLSWSVVFASGARRERAFTLPGAVPAERHRVAAAPREP